MSGRRPLAVGAARVPLLPLPQALVNVCSATRVVMIFFAAWQACLLVLTVGNISCLGCCSGGQEVYETCKFSRPEPKQPVEREQLVLSPGVYPLQKQFDDSFPQVLLLLLTREWQSWSTR